MVGCRGVFNVYIPAAHVTWIFASIEGLDTEPSTPRLKTSQRSVLGRGGGMFARTPGHETATSGTGVPAS